MVLRKSGRVGRRRSLKDIRRNMDVLFLCAIVSNRTRGDRRGGRAQRGPEALGGEQVGIAADLWKSRFRNESAFLRYIEALPRAGLQSRFLPVPLRGGTPLPPNHSPGLQSW